MGSLLGSLGSVDMDETSLVEEEEEDVGCGGLSITAAPVLRKNTSANRLHCDIRGVLF